MFQWYVSYDDIPLTEAPGLYVFSSQAIVRKNLVKI
jgi:hypothetical protein